MNLMKLMQQAQKLQAAQAEIADKTCETSDPSGTVTVIANGAGELKFLTLDPSKVSSENTAELQTLILNTANQALKDAREIAAKEMASNLDIPGLG
ncbi:MAG: YbaB/EbfC family nucleoid-associated protein [Verrucomicrobiota bacterium]